MALGRDLPKQRAGEPIQTRLLTGLREMVLGLMRLSVGGGLKLKWINGAPLILGPPEPPRPIYFAVTTPIPPATSTALGSGTGQRVLLNADGTLGYSAQTYVVFNDTGTQAPAGRYQAKPIDGQYLIDVWPCASAGQPTPNPTAPSS